MARLNMINAIGTKLVRTAPMSRQAYNDLRGWTTLDDEDLNEDGYLVEYVDSGKPNHPDFDNYISWSPKDVYEAAYREYTPGALTFGDAIALAKAGNAFARAGWNGKNMFVYYVPPGAYPAKSEIAKAHWGEELVPYGGYLAMKTATGEVVPWLASQSDVLAEDYEVITPEQIASSTDNS